MINSNEEQIRFMKQSILLILLLTMICCNKEKHWTIEGKWCGYSEFEGYFEYLIDTSKVYPCSFWNGANFPIQYLYEQDTIRYLNSNNYKAKVDFINKNIMIWTSKDFCDTLYWLNDTILTFHEINYNNEQELIKFFNDFKRRNKEYLNKIGQDHNANVDGFYEQNTNNKLENK